MFKIDSAIDTLNEKFGFYASYLVLPLIMVVVWEVLCARIQCANILGF